MTVQILTKKIHQLEKRLGSLEQRIRIPGSGAASLWTNDLSRWPSLKKSQDDHRRQVLKETGGVLKHKLPKDIVALQRRMRKDWER